MAKTFSIQSRLLKPLLIGLPLLWFFTTFTAGWRLWHEINEINDTQITQLTRYLIGISQESHFSLNTPTPSLSPTTTQSAPPQSLDARTSRRDDTDDHDNDNDVEDADTPRHEPRIFQLENSQLSGDLGDSEHDYMGFAIWSKDGTLLMADENGEKFPFIANQHGFLEPGAIKQDINPFTHQWRLFYAHDDNTNRVIIVGQNLTSRQEVIYKSLAVQLAPALIGLALFLILVVVAVKRGFAPLTQVSHTLQNRDPHDDQPLDVAVPNEIQPLVHALNHLFIKVADTLSREQRFTADASHELRSPLTALSLQTDVLQQLILQANLDDTLTDNLFHHTEQISHGAQRATHLVEQLLILAKLAPEQGLNPAQLAPINWLALSDSVLSEVNRQAREKHTQLRRTLLADTDQLLPLQGNPTLLRLLIRNLLDNAICYCPDNSTITLEIGEQHISVIDNGQGVDDSDLARLSERFYRPAGQREHGSGLGLSIVKRIADLHGLSVTMQNRVDADTITGFIVTLTPKPSAK